MTDDGSVLSSLRLQSMVDGEPGDLGEIAHVPVEEVCNTLSGTVTIPYPKMEANTVKAREFSTAPATLRPALIAMVRDSPVIVSARMHPDASRMILKCICLHRFNIP